MSNLAWKIENSIYFYQCWKVSIVNDKFPSSRNNVISVRFNLPVPLRELFEWLHHKMICIMKNWSKLLFTHSDNCNLHASMCVCLNTDWCMLKLYFSVKNIALTEKGPRTFTSQSKIEPENCIQRTKQMISN